MAMAPGVNYFPSCPIRTRAACRYCEKWHAIIDMLKPPDMVRRFCKLAESSALGRLPGLGSAAVGCGAAGAISEWSRAGSIPGYPV